MVLVVALSRMLLLPTVALGKFDYNVYVRSCYNTHVITEPAESIHAIIPFMYLWSMSFVVVEHKTSKYCVFTCSQLLIAIVIAIAL